MATHTFLFDGELDGDHRGPINAVLRSEWPEVESDGKGGRVVLVLDTSGSMSTRKKLTTAIEAAKLIHELLPAGYEFELVTYGSAAKVWARPGEEILSNVFDQIETYGSTNLEAGLRVALDLNREIKTTLPTTFIVMTDGEINMGKAQTPSALATLTKLYPESADAQWRLIGIGEDYSEGFMETFTALLPHCIFRHCTAALMADVMGEVVGMAFQTAARHIQVQIEPAQTVAHKSAGDPLHHHDACYLLPAAAGGSTTYCTFALEGTPLLTRGWGGLVSAHVCYHHADGVAEQKIIDIPVHKSDEAGVDQVVENILRLKVLAAIKKLPLNDQGTKILDELIAELKAAPRVTTALQKLIDMCTDLKVNPARGKACLASCEGLRTQSGGAYCTPTIAATSAAFGALSSCAPPGVSPGDDTIEKLRAALDKRKAKEDRKARVAALEESIRAHKAAGTSPAEVVPLIEELNRINPPAAEVEAEPKAAPGFFGSLFG